MQSIYPNYKSVEEGGKGFLILEIPGEGERNAGRVVVVTKSEKKTPLFNMKGEFNGKLGRDVKEILGPTRDELIEQQDQIIEEREK